MVRPSRLSADVFGATTKLHRRRAKAKQREIRKWDDSRTTPRSDGEPPGHCSYEVQRDDQAGGLFHEDSIALRQIIRPGGVRQNVLIGTSSREGRGAPCSRWLTSPWMKGSPGASLTSCEVSWAACARFPSAAKRCARTARDQKDMGLRSRLVSIRLSRCSCLRSSSAFCFHSSALAASLRSV